MARSYAGILGLIAMIVVAVRSLCRGISPDEALLSVTLALGAFTMIGLVVGKIADTVVVDSVWTKVRAELGALDKDLPEAQE